MERAWILEIKGQKSNLYKRKKLFKIDEIAVNKIFAFEIEPYGAKKSFKYFIGYNDNDAIRPLCIKLLQVNGFVKYFDNAKTMLFNPNLGGLFRGSFWDGRV